MPGAFHCTGCFFTVTDVEAGDADSARAIADGHQCGDGETFRCDHAHTTRRNRP